MCIPGRLLGEGPGQVILGLQISDDGAVYGRDGAGDKSGEVGVRTITRPHVYRSQVLDENRDRDHSRGSDRSDQADCGSDKEGRKDSGQAVFETVRSAEQLHFPGEVGQAIYKTTPALFTSVVETKYRRHKRQDSNIAVSEGTHPMVGGGGEFEKRDISESTNPTAGSGVGREQDGLGSVSGVGGRNKWCLARDRKIKAHQLVRNESSVQRPYLLSREDSSPDHKGEVRQHYGGRIHKQARWDAFDQPMLFSMGDAELVQGSSSHSAGGIHSGENECSGRSVFASRIASRMVPMPGGGERNFSDMGDSVHRSVRQFTHKEATNILFEGEGSNGVCDRQHVDQLEGSGGICISTGAIDSAGATEGQTGRVQNDFNSTELGETTVDVSANRSVGGRTKKTSSEEKAPKASGTAEVSPRSRNVKLICMEDKRSELRKKGFREESAKLATSDIRSTTCKTYGYKIQKYIDWCNQERIKHPRSSSVASVCNFLTDMFGKGASAHAISGYISALSKWHRKVHGKYLCEIEELRNIRKATAIQRPPKKVRFETWNLSLVLQNLTREPFEPMISAPMKFVSYKTVFLVAAATARRCSEIGALSMDAENFIERPRYIEIGYMPNFIPKNARVNYAGRTVIIPSFREMASCEEEELMCPVRALKCYVKRSALFRKEGEKRLFVTFGAGDSQGHGASNKTLARWIVETIKHAYSVADEEDCRVLKLNAHSVRSVATTYAILKGVSIQHILEAADWATATTFVNHYFKPGTGEGQAFAAAVLKAVGV